MKSKLIALLLVLTFLPQTSIARVISSHAVAAQGEAYIIIKPDIAHCFIKVEGEGASFNISKKSAQEQLDTVQEILNNVFDPSPEVSVIRTRNQPKEKSWDEAYEKDFLTGMAKAIKGEDVESYYEQKEKKKIMTTVINLYFTIPDYNPEKIELLRSTLADKNISFDKSSLFGFSTYNINLDSSAIVFGLKNPEPHLESLAAEAYSKAHTNAETIARAAGKEIGELVGISGCGGELEGTAKLQDSVWVGKDLGPLSSDPERLNIKFKKTFEFSIFSK